MFLVGYNTPFRIVLLVLIKRFCKYKFPTELLPNFLVLITNSVLNEDQIHKTCSEPTLADVITEIESFIGDPESNVVTDILRDLEKITLPYQLDHFMGSLNTFFDEEALYDQDREKVIPNRISVLGLFIRKCTVSYDQLSSTHLANIYGAFTQYFETFVKDYGSNIGDSELTNDKDKIAIDWVSDYNVKEFLTYQAEQIEKTGMTNISTTDLHEYLAEIEKHLPSLTNIHQVRYLNYSRSKEYIQSLFNLRFWSNRSINNDVGIQYALLNGGILEYKFGHLPNARIALDDALIAARYHQDYLCIQEVLYWIDVCRQERPLYQHSSYSDIYLKNLRILSDTRKMLQSGHACNKIFENLYKSQIDITMNNIENLNRLWFLISSLAWRRYGNEVISSSYLELAEQFGEKFIAEMENTVVTKASRDYKLGMFDSAAADIRRFVDEYENEKDVLIDWSKSRPSVLKHPSNKRIDEFYTSIPRLSNTGVVSEDDIDEWGLYPQTELKPEDIVQCKVTKGQYLDYDADLSQVKVTSASEDYIYTADENACRMFSEKETDNAANFLDNDRDFILERHQKPHLSSNLILEATTSLDINMLEQAMELARKCHDSENYYTAVIKLALAYIRQNDPQETEKAIYMLENIFPKVLVLGSKLLESDLNWTYAMALVEGKDTDTKKIALEYVTAAEKGYKQLLLHDKVLNALSFKAFLQKELGLTSDNTKTLQEIKELK